MQIDRVAWIHLAERTDRAEWMEGQLSRSRLLSGALELRCHLATPPEQLEIPDSFGPHGGHYSCRKAHLDLIEEALEDGTETLLVLEDDIFLPEDFDRLAQRTLAALPDGWWLCHLGACHRRAPLPWSKGLAVARGCTRTHAYLISRAGMEPVLEQIRLRQPNMAIDQALYWLHYRCVEESRTVCFAAHPFIVSTRDDYSTNNQQWEPGERFFSARRAKKDQEKTQRLADRLAGR